MKQTKQNHRAGGAGAWKADLLTNAITFDLFRSKLSFEQKGSLSSSASALLLRARLRVSPGIPMGGSNERQD